MRGLSMLIRGGRSVSSVSIGSFVHDVVFGSGWELVVVDNGTGEVVASRVFRRKRSAEFARGQLVGAVGSGAVDAGSFVAIRAAMASLPVGRRCGR